MTLSNKIIYAYPFANAHHVYKQKGVIHNSFFSSSGTFPFLSFPFRCFMFMFISSFTLFLFSFGAQFTVTQSQWLTVQSSQRSQRSHLHIGLILYLLRVFSCFIAVGFQKRNFQFNHFCIEFSFLRSFFVTHLFFFIIMFWENSRKFTFPVIYGCIYRFGSLIS